MIVGNTEAPPWLFENIAELSRNARTLHILNVGFLIYCAVTILTTADSKIILDQQAHLPVINLDITLSVFVLVAPVVAIIIFLYFQLYLHTLRELITKLHDKYGTPGKGRLYPWMINMMDEPSRGVLGKIQQAAIKLSLWWLLPIVLILFTYLTLKKHDHWLSVFEWVISFCGTALVFWLWCRYDDLGAGVANAAPPRPGKWMRAGEVLTRHWMKGLVAMLFLMLHVFLLIMIPEENKVITGWFSIKLRNEVLVDQRKTDFATYWIDLHNSHLEGADIYGAVLRRANLRKALLQGADLQLADLEEAEVSEANLDGAVLAKAKLKNATLNGTRLVNSNLNCADLSGATLKDADFSGASLVGAVLKETKDLEAAQLVKAKTLFAAYFGEDEKGKELKAALMKARPDLFQEIAFEHQVVDRLAPHSEIELLISLRNAEHRTLFSEYRTQRKIRFEHPDQTSTVSGRGGAGSSEGKDLTVSFLEERLVLKKAYFNTYLLEERYERLRFVSLPQHLLFLPQDLLPLKDPPSLPEDLLFLPEDMLPPNESESLKVTLLTDPMLIPCM